MSANSKFLKNRIKKLIGNVETLKQNTPKSGTKIRKQNTKVASKECGLFRDYGYIELERKQGPLSRNVLFYCYQDERIYDSYEFPRRQTPYYSEDSNTNQINMEVQKVFGALKQQLADCSSSHCEDTVSTDELP